MNKTKVTQVTAGQMRVSIPGLLIKIYHTCRLDRYLIGSLVYRQLAALRQTSLARKLIGSMNFNTKRCV